MERAALLGYTTGDYGLINPALRGGKGQITDPYLSAYTKEVKGALQKIPDYQAPSGQPSHLYRAIYPQSDPTKNNDWCKTAFVKGSTYSDFAFSSTAVKKPPQGEWNLTIMGTKNAKDITPYSSWPGEAEALVFPGQAYTVHDVVGKNVTLVPQ
jgi:ADP-ribosyltransferase exoenzyme